MSNSSVFAVICEPYYIGPFGGSFLTICFIDLLLPVLNLLLLVVFGTLRARTLSIYPDRLAKQHTTYQATTLLLSLVAILLPLTNIVYNGASGQKLPWFSYIQLCLQDVNWVLATLLAILEYRKSVKNGSAIISFWVLTSVVGAFR